MKEADLYLLVSLICAIPIIFVGCSLIGPIDWNKPTPSYPGHQVCLEHNGTYHKVSKCCFRCDVEINGTKGVLYSYNGTLVFSGCSKIENGLVYASAYCGGSNG